MSEFKSSGEFATTWVGGLGLIQGEEIVRCRDCKHMRETTTPSMLFADETFTVRRCGADQWSTASLMPMHSVTPDGFCAWGERKSE